MKVQCGQCPAKYAVSDERVRDRKVRIHCKRCGAAIVVDGKVNPPLVTSTPARRSVRPPANTAPLPESEPPPEREPESRPSPRPVAHTIMGGLEAPAAERLEEQRALPAPRVRSPASPLELLDDARPPPGMPAEHRGLTDPPLGSDATRWRVALTKQDLRWMTTSEIIEAYRSGAVKLETFVFRAGMPTWVTLPEVPEIASALINAGVETGSSISSIPPPKSPSSRPPPRRLPGRANALEANALAALAELDANEPMPFALVSERANGAGSAPGQAALDSPPTPPAHVGEEHPLPAQAEPAEFDASMPERPSIHERLSLEPLPPDTLSTVPDDPLAPMPFAAAQQASDSSKWVWVVVAALVLAAIGAYLASLRGVRLF